MTLLKTIALVLSLGLDTLAVAVGLGLSGLARRDRVRYGVSFALAEGIMPVVGFLLGSVTSAALGSLASYLAIALLLGVGLWMVREALGGEEEREYHPPSLTVLGATALSVSMDELAVGFSLGLLHIPLLLAVGLIALQAFAVTLLGTALGAAIGERMAERAELLSGAVLTALALFLLVQRVVNGTA